MSAHEMHTIEEFCSNILILNKGKTVLKGRIKDIKNSYNANRIKIETTTDITEIIEKNNLSIENSHDNSYVVKIEEEKQGYDLLKNLIKEKVNVDKFEIMKPTLNDIFIEKVGAKNA